MSLSNLVCSVQIQSGQSNSFGLLSDGYAFESWTYYAAFVDNAVTIGTFSGNQSVQHMLVEIPHEEYASDFDSWVQEQSLSTEYSLDGLQCLAQIKLSNPFNDEKSALWIEHDCQQFDLSI